MTEETKQLDAYAEHELTVAQRYKWWGVYLVREQRRLAGIAAAVQAEEAARATKLPPVVDDEGKERAEQLLTQVDTELELSDALAVLEGGEPKTHGQAVRDEESIAEDRLQRKSGQKATLPAKETSKADEEDS